MGNERRLGNQSLLTPFDVAAKIICPAIRGSVALKLIKDHHFTQKKVADELGLRQQAISNYIKGMRGTVGMLASIPEVSSQVEIITERILSGVDKDRILSLMNETCLHLLGDKKVCQIINGTENCIGNLWAP
ncbi:MAG: hypothetical protein M0T81_06090 [Thermoplasmatales archaeon]|nr:hypothetical protein [Thermoplasmatales archaeon]